MTGGDGGFCHIDEDNPNIQISAYTGNSYNITSNAWGSSAYVSFSGGKFINPTDYDSDNNILYTANGTGNYSLIKNVGTTNNTSTTSVASFSSTVSAITVSPNTNHRVFFGLERGLVFRVDDANTTAPSVTNISPPVSTPYCSSIAVQEGDDDHLLVTYSNYGTISVLNPQMAEATGLASKETYQICLFVGLFLILSTPTKPYWQPKWAFGQPMI
ncbi:MAG: hypothetical protein HC892_19000 [Saprospiraceae bacterium]|nr:hypothetical protein [Saprospiraceae bacterium]